MLRFGKNTQPGEPAGGPPPQGESPGAACEPGPGPRGLLARLGFGRPRPAPATTPPEPVRLAEPAAAAPEFPEPAGGTGLFKRLRERLSRSRAQLGTGLGNLLLGRKRIDEDLLEDLETLLLTADVGVEATTRIIDDLTQRVKRRSLADPQALLAALREGLRAILVSAQGEVRRPAPGRPQAILMVGVNGAGKTTTIGKLAKRLQDEGNSVMLAAGDTFRAAAVEQLQVWGERNRVPVIAQQSGADSASVCFDALQAAGARGVDVLIADTAGRLHTKTNLMDELTKIARVMKKLDPDAPHEVLLVVDATTGQNALNQALEFHRAVGLTGIALTKLDGTAKGGIVFAIAERLKVPIRFVGVGEGIEDLRPFDPDELLDALLG
jgi:fused signal recognition particle receptor